MRLREVQVSILSPSRQAFLAEARSLGWKPAHATPELHLNEIHLWLADVRMGFRARAAALSALSPEETSRYNEVADPEERNAQMISKGLLHRILSGYLGRKVDIAYPAGKPYLRGGPNFSLSHSTPFVLFAVSLDREVGADIELESRDLNVAGMASRFLPGEVHAILAYKSSDSRVHRFYQEWTKREALLKARGLGVSSFVRPSGTPGANDSTWNSRNLKVPTGLAASFAFKGGPVRISRRLLHEDALVSI